MEFLQIVCDKKGLSVTIPDSSGIHAIQQDKLPIPSVLSAEASNTVAPPSLKSSSLVSLGKLCG